MGKAVSVGLYTYRQVRAGIAKKNWGTFCEKDHRVIMPLLASGAGYPAVARDWFERIRNQGLGPQSRDELDGWTHFHAVYQEIFQDVAAKPDKDEFCRWLPLVEQFAF